MQRPRVSFPIQFEESASYSCCFVIRLDCQCAIPQRRRLGIAPQHLVGVRGVLQDIKRARFQLEAALEIAQCLFQFSLPTRDVAHHLEDTGIIR